MGHQDWRLVPVAVAVWTASWVGTSGWRPDAPTLSAMVAGLGLVAVVAARLGRPWTSLVVVVFTVTGLAAGMQAWHRHDSEVGQLAAQGATATALITVRSEPQRRGDTTVVQAALVWVEARGRRIQASVPVTVLATGEPGGALLDVLHGARYQVRVRLGQPRPAEAAAAVLRLRELGARVAEPGVLDSAANAMRSGLRAAVAHSPPRQAALVPSLVVGDTSRVDEEMRAQFQTTALTHLMAVSGANLTLMLGVVLAGVRALGLRGWMVRVTAVAGVAGFVLVCGPEPSVLRAAAMGVVALAAVGVGAGRRSVRALSLAVLGLVWVDPWMARSVGFGLSVAACAGIVLLGPGLVDAMARWGPRWLAEAVAVPLAAQLATQPIVTALSGEVSLVGVVTNALAGPFVGPTTVLGFAAALLCWAPWLAAGPGWLAGWCAQPILWLAEGGAALPSASWSWPGTPPGVLAVAVGSFALAVLLPRVLGRRFGAIALALVVVAGSSVRPLPLGWPGAWSAVFCDVGQGDATVVDAGSRSALLIDAGPDAESTLACLDGLGVSRLAVLILTHWHMDHIGGAAAVIARYRPELILTRAGPHPGWVAQAAASVGSVVRSAVPGERLAVGDATWTTVSVWEAPGGAVPEAEGEGSAENDASVVGMAEVRGLRVLLAGDAEPAGQAAALRAAESRNLSLSAHVLKLPHHGSARQEPRLFAAAGAVLAVASSGAGNPYGHPAQAALRLAAESGMAVARTDVQGGVAVALQGDSVSVRSWRPG